VYCILHATYYIIQHRPTIHYHTITRVCVCVCVCVCVFVCVCVCACVCVCVVGIEMEIVNSCENSNGGCSHHCQHSSGGPVCSCNHGYRLHEDLKTCVGKLGGALSRIACHGKSCIYTYQLSTVIATAYCYTIIIIITAVSQGNHNSLSTAGLLVNRWRGTKEEIKLMMWIIAAAVRLSLAHASLTPVRTWRPPTPQSLSSVPLESNPRCSRWPGDRLYVSL